MLVDASMMSDDVLYKYVIVILDSLPACGSRRFLFPPGFPWVPAGSLSDHLIGSKVVDSFREPFRGTCGKGNLREGKPAGILRGRETM